MSLLQLQRPRKAVYERGTVACRKCAAPLHVYRLKALADEFSLHCRKCGDRGIYLKRDLDVEALPERRRKPRQ